jgi:hypothetical protein
VVRHVLGEAFPDRARYLKRNRSADALLAFASQNISAVRPHPETSLFIYAFQQAAVAQISRLISAQCYKFGGKYGGEVVEGKPVRNYYVLLSCQSLETLRYSKSMFPDLATEEEPCSSHSGRRSVRPTPYNKDQRPARRCYVWNSMTMRG